MNNLFLLLFLFCFLALIVGIIKPQTVVRWGVTEKRNRKNVLKYYGIGLVVFFILFGVTSNNSGSKSISASKTVSQDKVLSPEEKVAADKAAADKVVADKVVADKAAADKVVADKVAADKAAADKVVADKVAADKVAADKAAADKAAADKVAYDTGITYNQLARTPDTYIGKKVKFSGKVIQVMEGDKEVDLRIAVNNNYDNVLFVGFDPKISAIRVLENDQVNIKGISGGIYTYQSTMGGNISIPSVLVDMITIN